MSELKGYVSKYPKKIRVKMNWSEDGIRRFKSAMGPTCKLPTYKWIFVENKIQEKHARGTPMTAEEHADLDCRRVEYYRQREEAKDK